MMTTTTMMMDSNGPIYNQIINNGRFEAKKKQTWRSTKKKTIMGNGMEKLTVNNVVDHDDDDDGNDNDDDDDDDGY